MFSSLSVSLSPSLSLSLSDSGSDPVSLKLHLLGVLGYVKVLLS